MLQRYAMAAMIGFGALGVMNPSHRAAAAAGDLAASHASVVGDAALHRKPAFGPVPSFRRHVLETRLHKPKLVALHAPVLRRLIPRPQSRPAPRLAHPAVPIHAVRRLPPHRFAYPAAPAPWRRMHGFQHRPPAFEGRPGDRPGPYSAYAGRPGGFGMPGPGCRVVRRFESPTPFGLRRVVSVRVCLVP